MSTPMRCTVGLAAVLATGLLAWGQVSPPAPATRPAGDDVLKVVPAGCMAFAVVNNVKGCTDRIDAFIKQVGASGLVPGPVLDLIKGQLKIGEGFNANSGLAAVLLDPQQYGLDLAGMISGKAKPDSQPPPVVVILAGKDPAAIFAASRPAKEGEVFKFTGGDGKPAYAIPAGEFVLVGDNLKAVQAVAASKKPVAEQLSPAARAFIAAHDLSLWVDMKMLSPILDAVVVLGKMQGKADAQMKDTTAAMKGGFLDALEGWREQLKQMTDLCLGAKVNQAGLVVEGQVAYAPDSAMAKTLAAYKPAGGPLLNRLPTMPYILAFGARNDVKDPREVREKEADTLLGQDTFKDLSPENKAKLREVVLGLGDQINGMQFFLGGITSGAGQVALVCVTECQSAEKVKDLLASATGLAADVIKNAPGPLKDLEVKYLKGVETAGEKKVDAVNIEHPQLTTLGEDERMKMKAVLGEDKIRVLLVPADEKTLVLTVGGGTGFLADALKTAAASSGELEKDPDVGKALAMLPKDKMLLGLLNVGNVMTVVKNISAALGQQPPPINLNAPTPFALSMSADKTSLSLAVFLPADTIREIIRTVQGFAGGGMAEPPPPGL